jgi:hypothetical protein
MTLITNEVETCNRPNEGSPNHHRGIGCLMLMTEMHVNTVEIQNNKKMQIIVPTDIGMHITVNKGIKSQQNCMNLMNNTDINSSLYQGAIIS